MNQEEEQIRRKIYSRCLIKRRMSNTSMDEILQHQESHSWCKQQVERELAEGNHERAAV